MTQNISVGTGANATFTIDIPANATDLTVSITGSGDLDLYVKNAPINWPSEQGSHNTATFKAPYQSGSSESVTFPSPNAGTWHVLVNGYSAGSGTITASWTVTSSSSVLANGVSQNLNLSTGENAEYTIDIPANASDLTVATTGSGDLDLYVKNAPINWPSEQGSHNTATFKAPYQTGSNESVTFPAPNQGTWYVLVNAYQAGSGTITASWTSGGTPQWNYETLVEETPHNYGNNQTYEFIYQKAGAQQVGVHFATLNTEANYDFLYVYDENDNLVYTEDGNLISGGSGSAFGRTDGWVVVSGAKIRIRLVTDGSVTRYGYKTDQAAHYQ